MTPCRPISGCGSPTRARSAPISEGWSRSSMRCPTGPSFLLLEGERRAVHAVALAGRRRAVGKDVAEMAAALGAVHLGAAHEEAAVGRCAHGAGQRLPERGPARAAFELGAGIEQRRAAAGAAEGALALLLIERAGAGALGAVLAQHLVLLRIERLAPLLVAFLDGERLGLGA